MTRVAPTAGDPGERLLHETVATHLAAIHARDLDLLLTTVTAADSLVLILPNGTTTFTRREYVAFHQAWFSDRSWTMAFEPLSATIRDGSAILLFRTTYTDARGDRPGLVSLAFAFESDGWRLIFDQNTRLPDA
jgi:ketosteroid isomerase-like protein